MISCAPVWLSSCNNADSPFDSYIQSSRPHLSIVVEPEVFAELGQSFHLIPLDTSDVPTLSSRIDFGIALGGDGTLLRYSTLFDAGAVPPVLGVSGGTLGFMMPICEPSLETG